MSDELVDRWRGWLAPGLQPFWVESLEGWPTVGDAHPIRSAAEDTYATWRFNRSFRVLWLDEVTYLDLPRARRVALVRAQIAHRRGAVPSVRRWSDLLDKASCGLRPMDTASSGGHRSSRRMLTCCRGWLAGHRRARRPRRCPVGTQRCLARPGSVALPCSPTHELWPDHFPDRADRTASPTCLQRPVLREPRRKACCESRSSLGSTPRVASAVAMKSQGPCCSGVTVMGNRSTLP